ncbi:MAG TPA: hypothetical protein VNA67_05440 [Pseudonocardiaceae bacterium]|nr:hypothetical protein [Pseudonocardiaceae bacterium]
MAGHAFSWSPGHAPVTLEDTDYVDYSPTAEFAAVIRRIAAQGN